jgi:hypothetical protein
MEQKWLSAGEIYGACGQTIFEIWRFIWGGVSHFPVIFS